MFLWLICLWLLLLGDPIQSSWLKPSFVTFKQCSLESQLISRSLSPHFVHQGWYRLLPGVVVRV